MRFMMFVATDSDPDGEPEAPGEVEAWVEDLEKRDKRIDGDRLRPAAAAKTVRVRSARRIVTDGPFAESKEAIIGFDILDCDSIEAAVEIAAKHPMARAGRLEVRAFWSFEEK
ncbi:MAG: YciI family protein [Alphaproteobacteria bacterium]|nr:YciI family protein [Alphaproteobacteria bacterium]